MVKIDVMRCRNFLNQLPKILIMMRRNNKSL